MGGLINQFKQKLQNRKLLLAGSAIRLSLTESRRKVACRPKGTGKQSRVLVLAS
jgi:hypothetical protein